MSTKSKNAVIIVVAAVVAYALGAVIGFPPVAGDLSKGDIAKVSRYSRNVVSPALSLVQEKLQADTSYRTQTLDMFTVVSARLSGFESLCELSLQATEGLDEFDAINTKLQANIPTAQNAALRGEEMVQALNDLVAGKKVDNFEQLSNNIVISYLLVDKEVSLGKTFVELADARLEKANDDKLAFVRDMWMDYCAIDAVLNGDQAETEYWSSKDYVLSSEQMSAFYSVADNVIMTVANASQLSVGMMNKQANSENFQAQNNQFQAQNNQFQAQNNQFQAQNNQFQTLNGGLQQFTQNFIMGETNLSPVVGK